MGRTDLSPLLSFTAMAIMLRLLATSTNLSIKSSFPCRPEASYVSAGRRMLLVEAAPSIATIMAIAVPASPAVTKVTSTKPRPEARAAIAAMAIPTAVPTATIPTPVAITILDVLDGRGRVRHCMNSERCC
jgi:hypothetical protein